MIDYQVLQTPPIEQYEHDFWLSEVETTSVDITTEVGSKLVNPYLLDDNRASYVLRFAARPDDEERFIVGLYAEIDRRKKGLSEAAEPRRRRELTCPNPHGFGVRNFSGDEDLIERLLDYEESLSPGSLRNIVHLTRLTRALYDEKDKEKKVDRAYDVIEYLDELPQIEHEILQDHLVDWTANLMREEAYCVLTEMTLRRMPKNVYHYKDYPAKMREARIRAFPSFARFLADFDEPVLPRKKHPQETTDPGRGDPFR